MPKRLLIPGAILAALTVPIAAPAQAAPVPVTGGQTSVALDGDLLESVGLEITGVSADVIVPGTLPGSVAFPINPRSGGAGLNTTFEYDPNTFPAPGSFSGTIEHTGTITFNDSITVGDFTIGFDPERVEDDASGFFVMDNVDLGAVLFDVAVTGLTPSQASLEVAGNLLISPEFAAALEGEGLAGVDIGDALIEASGPAPVPEPATLALLAVGIAGASLTWRLRRTA